MKKILALTWLLMLATYLCLAGTTLAAPVSEIRDVSFYPQKAVQGETVFINYTVYNTNPEAHWVLLRMYDVGETREEYYHPKDKRTIPSDGEKAFVYDWDTAGSKTGSHRIDILVTPFDEAADPLATYSTTYTLNASGSTSPSPSASPTNQSGKTTPTATKSTTSSLSTQNNPVFKIPNLGKVVFPHSNITSVRDLLIKLIYVSVSFAGVWAVIGVIWSGYIYITAGSNAERAEKAKKNLVWAITGIVIIATSALIVYTFVRIFSGEEPLPTSSLTPYTIESSSPSPSPSISPLITPIPSVSPSNSLRRTQ